MRPIARARTITCAPGTVGIALVGRLLPGKLPTMGHAYREFDWYEAPLYYDIVYADGTDADCDFLEALYRRYTPSRHRRVLEPACGSGRLVVEMARRGYRVLGFDLSPGSVAFANRMLAMERRERRSCGETAALHARAVEADMESFRPRQRFELAHCLVSSFQHLLSERAAIAHLNAMAAALMPGGIYALSFHVCQYDEARVVRERYAGVRGDMHVVCNIQTWPPSRRQRRQKMRSRIVVEQSGLIRRFESCWEFRTYDAGQFLSLVAKIPEFAHIATYDFDYDLERPQQCELGAERLDQVVILQRQ